MAGATTIAYEGALDHPDADAPWSIIEREGVTGVFTLADRRPAPDALRRGGPEAARPRSSLERVFSAGEVLNAPAWEWLQQTVFEDRVPVIDHMWQTETGGPIFGNPYGYALLPIKPGSAGVALPGIEADVVDQDGKPVGVGEKGDHADQAAVPRADRDPVGRARALRRRLLGNGSPAATTSATPRTSTRTATSGSPAGPTRSSRSPTTASGRSRSRPRSCAIPPSPRRA